MERLPKIIVCENEFGAIQLARVGSVHYEALKSNSGNTFYPLTMDMLALPPMSTEQAVEKMKDLIKDTNPDMASLPSLFESEEEKILNGLKRYTKPNDYKKLGNVELIENIEIESSNIGRIGYTDKNEIFIEFNNLSQYVYQNVPKNEFDKMKFAPSIGSFLGSEIKGKYRYVRIDN
jgi:hypothetical protein